MSLENGSKYKDSRETQEALVHLSRGVAANQN